MKTCDKANGKMEKMPASAKTKADKKDDKAGLKGMKKDTKKMPK